MYFWDAGGGGRSIALVKLFKASMTKNGLQNDRTKFF